MESPLNFHFVQIAEAIIDQPDIPTQLAAHKKALTVAELAGVLTLSSKQVHALVAKGYIPSYRIAESIRFDPVRVGSWLRSQAAT